MRTFFISAVLVLGGYGSAASALPIALNGQYSVGGQAAVLAADGTLFEDGYTLDSAAMPLPLLGTASVGSDAGSVASTLAAADSGSLLVITDTVANGESADAGAGAIFSGDFSVPGSGPGQPLRLSLDITNDAQVGGVEAFAQAILRFALVGAGQVLFDETLVFGPADIGAQTITRDFFLSAGASGLLDVSLLSRSGSFDGAANNTFSVGFDLNTVPEPAVVLNVLAGLALLAWMRRRSKNADGERAAVNT